MSKNPTRNYAIQWLQRGQTVEQAAATAAAVIASSPDATGDVFGDVSGSLLGPLITTGLLGYPVDGPPEDGKTIVFDLASGTWLLATPGTAVTVEDEGTPLATAADTLNFVGAGVTATGTGGTKTITIPSGGGGSGTPGWFNVKDPAYGATGDGTTDDTAAINLAIAALIAAGRGVLYFPAGTYKVTSALTTISVPALVLGDGMYGSGTTINCTSQTAVLFTTSVAGVSFSKLKLVNTYAGTASAGGAIVATNAAVNIYEQVFIFAFYTSLDIEDSLAWQMRGCYIGDSHKYGVRIRNTAVPDAGDWTISDSIFSSATAADAAIRIESSGGGKIVNVKINGGSGTSNFAQGIDIAIGTGVDTAILLVSNVSIENVSGNGIRGTTSAATSKWGKILVENCQFSILGNSGKAISLVATTVGDFYEVVISGCEMGTSGTARSAMTLTKTNNVIIGPIALLTFNDYFTSSGNTNLRDDTGGIAAGVQISGTPSVGDVPIATSGTAAAWGAGSGVGPAKGTPATSYGTPAAGSPTTYIGTGATIAKPTAPDVDFSADVTTSNATTGHHGLLPKLDGNAAHALLGDGTFGTPTGTAPTEAQIYGVGGHWELLMDPASSSPPVPLTTPDGTDWVYGWLSDGG